MQSDYLEEDIDKRRRRATKLGVDDLVCSVLFTEGFRHYASWSQDPEWVCPSVSEVRTSQPGALGFTLKGRRYSIHTEDDHSPGPTQSDATRISVSLLLDGNLVFAEMIEHYRIDDIDSYIPERVTAFIEGDWVDAFRDLEREMKQIARRNLQRIRRERAQREAASGAGRLRRIWRALRS